MRIFLFYGLEILYEKLIKLLAARKIALIGLDFFKRLRVLFFECQNLESDQLIETHFEYGLCLALREVQLHGIPKVTRVLEVNAARIAGREAGLRVLKFLRAAEYRND